ncbi:MAG: GNAT family N-acetyltransferase [Clostridiales bacterium]|nr:GNAT family N-acetyltransferase [Clostridiales bacterium]
MDEMMLIEPDISLTEEIRDFRQEMIEAGSDMDGCGSLRRHEEPRDWIDFNLLLKNRETVPEKWVVSTQFAYVRRHDKRIMGMIQVRHYLNDYLRDYAGHIGYSVRPSERRKGVATAMLRAVLPFCRSIGLDRVMIACEPDNPGSRGTILNNGGVYWRTVHFPPEDIDLEQYWVET